MIKVSDGAVSISGATVDIIKELSMAIYGVYESLVDRYDDETAREIIAECGVLAFKDFEEYTAKISEMHDKQLAELRAYAKE